MFRNFCDSKLSSLARDACVVNLWQVFLGCILCLWLFIVELVVLFKHRTSLPYVFQRLHNIRSAVELLLFIVGTLELASALLPGSPQQDSTSCNAKIPFRTTSAILSLAVALSVGVFHCVTEVKNYPGLLYNCIPALLTLSIVRAYKLADVLQYYDTLHLEVFIQTVTLSLLLLLASFDGFVVYKEVAIYFTKPYLMQVCGGNLIHVKFVLTAAHCFNEEKDPEYVKIMGGDTDKARKTIATRVEEYVQEIRNHPKYNSKNYHYDYSILVLKKAVTENENFRTIQLVQERPENGALCSIAGWGLTNPEVFQGSNVLRFAEVPIHSFEECSKMPFRVFNDTMLCAGVDEGGTDSCLRHKSRTKPVRTSTDTPNIGYKHSVTPFFSKIVFWWLNSLLWKGYKIPLEQEDIGNLPEEDSARYHYDQFLFIYKTEKVKCARLWLCYLKSSWKLFILGGLFKLLGDLSALVGPLSIYQIVEYFEQQQRDAEHKLHSNPNEISSGSGSMSMKFCETSIEAKFGIGGGGSSSGNTTSFRNGLPDGLFYPGWNELLSNGWVMAWFVLLSSLAQGTLSQAATHIVNMIGIRIKTSLQGLVYRKVLLLSSSCLYRPAAKREALMATAAAEPIEEDSLTLSMSAKDVGAITNLMSEDAQNIMTFFWIAHYVWSIPLKVAIIMYLLYLKLGVSAIIGSLVCISTMIPLQFLIGKAMSNNAEKAAECSDRRLKKTNDIFLGIKLIKLNAWENVFQEKISQTRNQELKHLNRDSIYWFLMTTLAHVSSVLITFVTLAVFIKLEGDTNHASISHHRININNTRTGAGGDSADSRSDAFEFTSGRLFSALALFNQLTVPLFIFPITVPIIISAIVSTRRLERFLAEPEVEREFEGIRNMARILSKSDASLDMYESSNEPSTVETVSTISEQISISPSEPKSPPPTNKSLACETSSQMQKDFSFLPKKKTEIIRNSRVESVRFRQKSAPARESIRFSASENTVVSISNAYFSWDRGDSLLRVAQLEIPKGKFTVIVGKSGSGKTSLISAFLKEMHLLSGDVVWNKYATTAYVPQLPWLLNSTIRENVLFGESFRPKRYEKVLESCALKPDLELMPAGDMTVIDERGINLSGGQKQRVAIARALYSSANVVIMDDPLSSLDNEVAKYVYDSVKKMLSRAGRTMIMATQRLQLVYDADYIVAMKDSTVEVAGSYSEIERKHVQVVMDWSAAMSKGFNVEQTSNGKTARERWRLFKNVSKLGLQKQPNNVSENMSSTQSLLTSKRRQSVFGSRHLTYEMPLPIDECQNDDLIIWRRGSRSRRKCHSLELTAANRKSVLRVNSLQTQPLRSDRSSVTRIVSSPIPFYENKNKIVESDFKSKSGFRQFLNRMSSRRSNSELTARPHKSIRVSNSIQSISEEVPATRLPSDSCNSSMVIDDDSVDCFDESEEIQGIGDEERKYGAVPLNVYLFYLKACGVFVVMLYLLATILWQSIRVYTDFWLRDWTDNGNTYNETYYFRLYALISHFCIFVSLISTLTGQIAGCRARRKLHDHLLQTIISKPFFFFQTTPIGRILNRFSNDISIVDKKISTTIQRLLQFMLLCLFAVLINTSITLWFFVLTIPICAAYYFIQKFYRRSSRELQRIESITSSPVLSHLTETIEGVTTIRAYNQEYRFTEILFKRLEAHNAAFIILNVSNRWLGIALDYLGGIVVFIVIITALVVGTIGSYEHENQQTNNTNKLKMPPLSASMVGMAINYTLFIPIYLNWVVKLLADMEMYIGAVERIASYGEVKEDPSSSERVYTSVPISWPTKSDIAFQNVTLRYEGRQSQDVIKNLTLKIPAGSRIGICGRTGSGKSSLVLSLFGVLEVVEGQILLDNVDITTVKPDEIRSRLSIIPQDVHLFNATIRENLDPRGYFTDLQLWNCLELAQLKDVVSKLPLGIETEIADGGSNLSAGQRQLFCLARAILRGSVCLILDEATSSLDGETESALLTAADNAFKGRTIITIAHRLSTILNYDRIIVLENGVVVEDGAPSALETIPNGKFASMLKTAST